MKNFVLVILFSIFYSTLFAQDCNLYIYLQKGKVIETTTFNAQNVVMRKMVATVSNVTTTNGVTVANVSTQSYGKDGQPISKNSIVYKCSGSEFMVDMASQNSDKVKMDAGFISYPANMKVGDHLADVTLKMTMTIGQTAAGALSKITDRTVVAKESITTPAGTWTAFKITYKTSVALQGTQFANMPAQSQASTEYYVPNFGVLKYQLYGMTIEVTSIK